MKNLVKSMDEYAYELFLVAKPESVQEFFKFMADGNRLKAIKVLQEYKIIE